VWEATEFQTLTSASSRDPANVKYLDLTPFLGHASTSFVSFPAFQKAAGIDIHGDWPEEAVL
jgi:hypothetical protein